MTTAVSRPQLWPEIRVLILAAMAIFVYTIGIGILNGTDLVDFDQRRILGHVHGGTLGWLTLSVFAASLWLFGESAPIDERERTILRFLVGAAIIAFVIYIYAFSTTYGRLRPVMGIASTAVVAAFFLWVLTRVRDTVLGVPHWGFLAALGTSIVGGVLGVLLGFELATGNNFLPEGGEDAHPATMVVGFLVPVVLAMAEWSFTFPAPPRATRAGIIQMVFPFLGGIILMLSLLLDVTPLAPIAIGLEMVGIGIFLYRLRRSLRAVRWMSPQVHAVASVASVIFVIGLAQYFIIRYEGDFDLAPQHQLLALDHAQFIGAMTNAVFAMLLAATIRERRGAWLEGVVFVAVMGGLIGFATGLMFDATAIKRTFAPIMGVGLLVGLGLYASRLAPLDFWPGRTAQPGPEPESVPQLP
ncbi:MAG: hypothetical protein ACR2HN_00725 [Tepidiformaceae bacterium]